MSKRNLFGNVVNFGRIFVISGICLGLIIGLKKVSANNKLFKNIITLCVMYNLNVILDYAVMFGNAVWIYMDENAFDVPTDLEQLSYRILEIVYIVLFALYYIEYLILFHFQKFETIANTEL